MEHSSSNRCGLFVAGAVLLAAIILALAGCAGGPGGAAGTAGVEQADIVWDPEVKTDVYYADESAPREQCAVILDTRYAVSDSVDMGFIAYDGRPVEWKLAKGSTEMRVFIPAGKHRLTWSFLDKRGRYFDEIYDYEFEFQAGHTYSPVLRARVARFFRLDDITAITYEGRAFIKTAFSIPRDEFTCRGVAVFDGNEVDWFEKTVEEFMGTSRQPVLVSVPAGAHRFYLTDRKSTADLPVSWDYQFFTLLPGLTYNIVPKGKYIEGTLETADGVKALTPEEEAARVVHGPWVLKNPDAVIGDPKIPASGRALLFFSLVEIDGQKMPMRNAQDPLVSVPAGRHRFVWYDNWAGGSSGEDEELQTSEYTFQAGKLYLTGYENLLSGGHAFTPKVMNVDAAE
jgi:hypothetical protein